MNENFIKVYEKKIADCQLKDEMKIVLYGIGDGAEIIYSILCEQGRKGQIYAVVDNDAVIEDNLYFHGLKVQRFSDVFDKADIILICALINHKIVKNRVIEFLKEKGINDISVFNPFGHNTIMEKVEYLDYIENDLFRKDQLYKSHNSSSIKFQEKDTKVIAWYLPQYHKTEINDKYHGKGFTDWINTSKAMPMFTGHYQPHIPYDVGYYDLNDPDVFVRQISLAKQYGVYGFSFYYYWFSGEKTLEKPLEFFLSHKELNIHFCLTWANENWSKLWDGGNKEIILEQKLKEDDDVNFIRDILPYLEDERYITIDNKPLLLLYRPNLWTKERVRLLFENFRKEYKRLTNKELFLVICNTFGFDDEATEWGADASAEFPPHNLNRYIRNVRFEGYLNPNYVGYIRDAEHFIEDKGYLSAINCKKYFRAAVPSWDNSSRKAYSGANIFTGFTPETFRQWMIDIMQESKIIHSQEEDIVFVNAWNEWAEGAHLEPDMRYGYAYLDALKTAIESVRL